MNVKPDLRTFGVVLCAIAGPLGGQLVGANDLADSSRAKELVENASVTAHRPAPTGLTVEERVRYQRAIEEVYGRHRIWPAVDPPPRPGPAHVVSQAVLREKVANYLAQSQALAAYWQRPITAAQLQAEMDRMARQTRQPARLREIWAALGNDPYVIAECLARPALVQRLVRSWDAGDSRFHGVVKVQAEAKRQQWTEPPGRLRKGKYHEVVLIKGDPESVPEPGEAIIRNGAEWDESLRELARELGRGEKLSGPAPRASVREPSSTEELPTGIWRAL